MLTAAEAGRFGDRVEKLMTRGRLYFESEYLSKEGRVIPVEVNARLMWRGGRRLVISVARDVSRRRRFERERNRLTTALEHAAECIIVTDSNGHIQYVNPAFENITGYSREEITAKHVDILGYGAASEQRESILRELRSGGVWTGKLINRRKDGGEVEVEASISPVRDENGAITNYVAVERDTSYESKLERQLRQAQKMEAIGSLAGGIAHDLNNNLLPIIVNLEMVKDRMSDTKLQGRLADALASAGRARDLVRQILDFSRKSRGGRELMDLRDTVEEVLRAARVTAGTGVILESAAADAAYRVDADPTQMHRAVFNLVTNAMQSLGPDGGYVRVGLEHLDFKDERDAPHAEMPAGSYVAIKVTDSGSGICIEDRDRIFEPFFTTRKPGNGVGLGLAVVHGIVLSHGGAMTVESEINCGSTFTAYLPAAADGGYETKDPESKSNRASAGSAEA
jgi:PAS domain S-box-containing protein